MPRTPAQGEMGAPSKRVTTVLLPEGPKTRHTTKTPPKRTNVHVQTRRAERWRVERWRPQQRRAQRRSGSKQTRGRCNSVIYFWGISHCYTARAERAWRADAARGVPAAQMSQPELRRSLARRASVWGSLRLIAEQARSRRGWHALPGGRCCPGLRFDGLCCAGAG